MKTGDKFIDFDRDLEMKIVSITDSCIKCVPTRNSFREDLSDSEYYGLLMQHGKEYTDFDFVKVAVEDFSDDCTK
jgi:hypothetical protein